MSTKSVLMGMGPYMVKDRSLWVFNVTGGVGKGQKQAENPGRPKGFGPGGWRPRRSAARRFF